MKVRHLEFFAAVTRRGSFSGASVELGVTQSALSQAIAALEADVGAALFDRSPGGVRLTAAGREFLPHATTALTALHDARAAVTRVDRLEGGELAIACPASLGIDPLPGLIAAFRQEFPDVAIRVHDLGEHRVDQQELFDLGADVVVTFAELVADELHAARLAPVELFAVLPRRDSSAVTLEEVLAHGLITTPVETAPHRFVTSRVGREALESAIAVQAEHPEAVLPLVLGGAGAAILPAGHARVASGVAGLVQCRLDPPAAFDVVVALPRASRSIAAHQFLRVCREAA